MKIYIFLKNHEFLTPRGGIRGLPGFAKLGIPGIWNAKFYYECPINFKYNAYRRNFWWRQTLIKLNTTLFIYFSVNLAILTPVESIFGILICEFFLLGI